MFLDHTLDAPGILHWAPVQPAVWPFGNLSGPLLLFCLQHSHWLNCPLSLARLLARICCIHCMLHTENLMLPPVSPDVTNIFRCLLLLSNSTFMDLSRDTFIMWHTLAFTQDLPYVLTSAFQNKSSRAFWTYQSGCPHGVQEVSLANFRKIPLTSTALKTRLKPLHHHTNHSLIYVYLRVSFISGFHFLSPAHVGALK